MTILLLIALEIGLAVFGGWGFMLGVGVVHHEWIPACPTIALWPAVAISLCLRWALFSPQLGGE